MLRRLACALAGTLLCTASAHAAEVEEPIILEARVNGVRKGDTVVRPEPGASIFWVKQSDYERLGVVARGLPSRVIAQESFVGLQNSPKLRVLADLENLELKIEASPELLGTQVVSLSSATRAALSPPASAHAFVNYSLARQQESGGAGRIAAEVAPNLVWGGWTLRSEYSYTGNSTLPRLRMRTFAMHDRPEDLVRITVGDISPNAGTFTRAGPLGGLNLSRLFDLQPGLVRTPAFGHSGSVTAPSKAEIYVDGSRLRTIDLKPGMYEFRDLSYFSGLRDVQVVITDTFGRREAVVLPFYFTDQNLRAGLSEFSYSLGQLRRGPGAGYGEAGFSGFHRYGLTDAATFGLAAERYPGYAALHGNAVLRLGNLGSLSINTGRSSTSVPGKSAGSALAASYGYSGRGWSLGASYLGQGRNFGRFPNPVVSAISLAPAALRDHGTLSYAVGITERQNIGLELSRTRSYGAPETSVALARYGLSVAKGVNLNASLARRDDGLRRGVEVMLSLSINPDRDWNITARHERGLGGRSLESLRASRSIPASDGVGGRFGIDRSESALASDVFVQYNSAYGAASGSLRRQEANTGAVTSGSELRFSGALAWFDAGLFAARSIDQSFAVVDASGLAGVRVYQNNQLLGRTRSDGRLLAPSLGAYNVNQIQLDDRDIPLEISLSEIMRVVVPRALSGTLVRFSAKRVSAAGGRLAAMVGGRRVAVAEAALAARNAERTIETSTGPDGDFYLEDLAPGEYRLSARTATFECSTVLLFAEGKEAFTDFGELDCANVRLP